jgi:hypothetical protein
MTGGRPVNKDFSKWWEVINKHISKVLVLLFSALLVSQFLLMNNNIKTIMSRTDKLEGISIEDSQLFIKKGELEITIENDSYITPLVFYINGERAASASGRSVRLTVKDNDIIEVSGADSSDVAVLKITAISDNVIVPELGKLVYVNNNLVMIDRVKLQ